MKRKECVMNIGIIVYSQTGNTYSVAEKLKQKLAASNHTVTVEKVIPSGDVRPGMKNVRFDTLPAVEKYDALVFGAPVQAFSLSVVMSAYLDQLSSLSGKKTVCFVTKALPFNWTGANSALNKMKSICESKSAKIDGTGVVHWGKTVREQSISSLLEETAKLF
jgi:NAD(P)H dehydrogenase (quinone)